MLRDFQRFKNFILNTRTILKATIILWLLEVKNLNQIKEDKRKEYLRKLKKEAEVVDS